MQHYPTITCFCPTYCLNHSLPCSSAVASSHCSCQGQHALTWSHFYWGLPTQKSFLSSYFEKWNPCFCKTSCSGDRGLQSISRTLTRMGYASWDLHIKGYNKVLIGRQKRTGPTWRLIGRYKWGFEHICI